MTSSFSYQATTERERGQGWTIVCGWLKYFKTIFVVFAATMTQLRWRKLWWVTKERASKPYQQNAHRTKITVFTLQLLSKLKKIILYCLHARLWKGKLKENWIIQVLIALLLWMIFCLIRNKVCFDEKKSTVVAFSKRVQNQVAKETIPISSFELENKIFKNSLFKTILTYGRQKSHLSFFKESLPNIFVGDCLSVHRYF